MGPFIAVAAILVIAFLAVFYEVWWKPRKNTVMPPASKMPSAPTPPPPAQPPAGIKLTHAQAARLFDEVLPRYWERTAPAERVVIKVKIGDVGSWLANSESRTLVRYDGGSSSKNVIVDVRSLDTFNEILSRDSYSTAYFAGLALTRRVAVTGDLSRLDAFTGLLEAVQADREAILRELGA